MDQGKKIICCKWTIDFKQEQKILGASLPKLWLGFFEVQGHGC